jgi:hypothetical protein
MLKKFIVEVDMKKYFDASVLRIALMGMMVKVISIKELKEK